MKPVALILLSASRVSHSEWCRELPFLLELDQPLRVVAEDDFAEAAKADSRVDVAKIEDAVSVGRANSLLQHHQEVVDARLAGAVGSEENSQRGEVNRTGVLPALEVLDSEVTEHVASLMRWSATRSADLIT
jgi:hypothetical protein